MGATHIRLAQASEDVLAGALFGTAFAAAFTSRGRLRGGAGMSARIEDLA